MKYKRILALVLVLVLTLGMAIPVSAASAPRKASDFTDFNASAWYAEAVAAAVADGLLYGKSNTILDLDASITRQEIMTVVARALYLDLDRFEETDLTKFADYRQISNWALPYVRAMVGAGYIQGHDTGLAAQASITRAEFAQLFFNIVSQYITKSGSFNGNLDGNLLIRSENVTLKDSVINGDLILGNGVADGKITLSNVTITGHLVVWGGGFSAVYCNDGTDVGELIVCRVDNPVNLSYSGELHRRRTSVRHRRPERRRYQLCLSGQYSSLAAD